MDIQKKAHPSQDSTEPTASRDAARKPGGKNFARRWGLAALLAGVATISLWQNSEVSHPDPYNLLGASLWQRLSSYPLEITDPSLKPAHLPVGDSGSAMIGRAAMAQRGQCAVNPEKVRPDSLRPSPDGRRVFALNSQGQPIISSDGCQSWQNLSIAAAKNAPFLGIDRHNDIVYEVAWSPDGRSLATASGDSTARIWDTSNGETRLTLQGHTDRVNSVAWSPDGRSLATASGDNTARIWDTSNGETRLTLQGHTDLVSSVAWSPDGRSLATASGDNTTRIWDTSNGETRLTLQGHTDLVSSVAWSPDGRSLATASGDNTARIWDTSNGETRLTLQGHTDLVSSVAWSPDGRSLATASGNNTVRIWHYSATSANAEAIVEAWRLIAHGETARAIQSSFDKEARLSPGNNRLLVIDTEQIHQFAFADGLSGYQLIRGPASRTAGFLSPINGVPGGRSQLSIAVWWPEQRGYLLVDEAGRLFGASEVASDKSAFNIQPDWQALTLPAGLTGKYWLHASGGKVVLGDATGRLYTTSDWPTSGNAWIPVPSPTPLPQGELVGMAVSQVDGKIAAALAATLAIKTDQGLIHAFIADLDTGIFSVLPQPVWKGRVPLNWLFLLIGFLLTGLAMVTGYRHWQAQGRATAGIGQTDKPLALVNRDLFGAKNLAWQLARIIKSRDTRPPMTIALNGVWGSGKSSVMVLATTYLRQFGQCVAWVDPWHQRSDADMLGALAQATNDTMPPLWQWRGLWLRLWVFWSRSRELWLSLSLIGGLVGLAVWLVPLLWPQHQMHMVNNFTWLGDLLGLLASEKEIGLAVISVLGALFAPRWFSLFPSVKRGFISRVGALFSVGMSEPPTSLYHRFGREYALCAHALRKTGSGLVIMIDDLDRCQASRVVEVFELINMLALSGPAIVVLGMDKGKVEDAITLHRKNLLSEASEAMANPDDLRREAHHYLEKLINVNIELADFSGRYIDRESQWPETLRRAQRFLFWDKLLAWGNALIVPTLLATVLVAGFYIANPHKYFGEATTQTAAVATPTTRQQATIAPETPPLNDAENSAKQTRFEAERFPGDKQQPPVDQVVVTTRTVGPLSVDGVPDLPERESGFSAILALVVLAGFSLTAALFIGAFIHYRRRMARAEAAIFQDSGAFADYLATVATQREQALVTPRDHVRLQIYLRAYHLLNTGGRHPSFSFAHELLRYWWNQAPEAGPGADEAVDQAFLDGVVERFFQPDNVV